MTKIEINLPESLRDEYEPVDYRKATRGELYVSNDDVLLCEVGTIRHYIILRKKERWRPATIDDVIRAIKGEEVEARELADRKDNLIEGILVGGWSLRNKMLFTINTKANFIRNLYCCEVRY